MKKILALLLSSTTGLIIIAIIILVPILMIMDFFGANITDGYVEDNMEYAEQYKSVVNKNFKKNNGYVRGKTKHILSDIAVLPVSKRVGIFKSK